MTERKGFADLIEALSIFETYITGHAGAAGTHCEHDILTIGGVEPSDVSPADKRRLSELGFDCNFGEFQDDEEECFTSFRWGSC